MVTYKVVITPHALHQLQEYHDYIRNTLLSEQAARNVWQDAFETIHRLSSVAGSMRLCSNPQLRNFGYRVIHFQSHRYVMIYRIEDDTAYIEAVYHHLQNYETLFFNDLED